MTKAKVLHTIEDDGVRYEKGATFEGSDEVVAQLIAAGALRDPKAPAEEEDTSTDDATAEAQQIIDDAKAEAEKIRETAEKEAEGILSDAKDEAGKVGEAAKVDADKVIADAKAEAEKIKKAPQSK